MVAVWNRGISVVAKNSLKLFSQPGSANSTPGRSAQRVHTGARLLQPPHAPSDGEQCSHEHKSSTSQLPRRQGQP